MGASPPIASTGPAHAPTDSDKTKQLVHPILEPIIKSSLTNWGIPSSTRLSGSDLVNSPMKRDLAELRRPRYLRRLTFSPVKTAARVRTTGSFGRTDLRW